MKRIRALLAATVVAAGLVTVSGTPAVATMTEPTWQGDVARPTSGTGCTGGIKVSPGAGNLETAIESNPTEDRFCLWDATTGLSGNYPVSLGSSDDRGLTLDDHEIIGKGTETVIDFNMTGAGDSGPTTGTECDVQGAPDFEPSCADPGFIVTGDAYFWDLTIRDVESCVEVNGGRVYLRWVTIEDCEVNGVYRPSTVGGTIEVRAGSGGEDGITDNTFTNIATDETEAEIDNVAQAGAIVMKGCSQGGCDNFPRAEIFVTRSLFTGNGHADGESLEPNIWCDFCNADDDNSDLGAWVEVRNSDFIDNETSAIHFEYSDGWLEVAGNYFEGNDNSGVIIQARYHYGPNPGDGQASDSVAWVYGNEWVDSATQPYTIKVIDRDPNPNLGGSRPEEELFPAGADPDESDTGLIFGRWFDGSGTNDLDANIFDSAELQHEYWTGTTEGSNVTDEYGANTCDNLNGTVVTECQATIN